MPSFLKNSMSMCLGLVAVAALSQPVAAEAEQVQGAHGMMLPASFTGTLPCADCEGIRYHLDLYGDTQSFGLRREWLRGDDSTTEYVLGRWHADPARQAVILEEPLWEAPQEWQVLGNGDLRLLDQAGQPIESALPYNLEAGPLDPVDLTLAMTGQFVYFADSALFTECLTGQRVPVAMEGGYLAAERSYLAALDLGMEPASPLLMTLKGTLTERPAMEGPPTRTLVVDEMLTVTPGGSCERSRMPADLVNTYWRILSLDGVALEDASVTREPYLLLFEDEGNLRLSATAGCNMMMGGAERDGDALSFGPVAATMMACPPPVDAWEQALAQALEATAAVETDGLTLTLLGDEGQPLAELEAAYTPF